MFLRLTFLSLMLSAGLTAQPFPERVRLQGYEQRGDTLLFIFDPSLYGADPAGRVVVTGAFRGWDQDMEDARWWLEPHPLEPALWTLAVPNADHAVLEPSTPFKFRIDGGVWMDPPVGAPNAESGNLVYLHDVAPPRLRAELRGPLAVWASVTGQDRTPPLERDAYALTDAHGAPVPIARVWPHDAEHVLLVPERPLDVRRVYHLETAGLHARVGFDGLYRTLYSDEPLGAEVAEGQTTFRVFSPRAGRIRLFLYEEADDTPEQATAVVEMQPGPAGVWEAVVDGDRHGTYYDFTVHADDDGLARDPGSTFYETDPVHVSDPYARVQAEAWGKSRAWRPTTPATPLPDGRPAMEDVVAYEVHVQDFTDRLPVEPHLRGTFEAMGTPGLTNAQGAPVGFDYLVGLGVNVVHLMPIQEFLHYPMGAWQEAFGDDPYFREHDIARENYQWGYRTTHAFAIENRFRTPGTEHGAEREQFRNLVQAFHDAGLAVIVDLVPNHTGENMDGAHHLLHWNVLSKAYHYRLDEDLEHIGPFGNEVKTEERPMTQRWLIDQCRALIDEFGIDGFRIDLAGQVDKQTLRALRAALPDDVIIYGEPWIPPTDPAVARNPAWGWYKADAPITFFQDDARNAFKGPVSNPQDKRTDRGYAGGDAGLRGQVMHAILNSFPDERDPNRGINYLDIHDNWALADRFARTDWNGLEGVDEPAFKLAAGLLFTSLGPVVLHGGTEIMRSKGSAPLVEFSRPFGESRLYFHGKRDTYNLRAPNQFVWDTVGQTTATHDYAGMLAYWKGLIALRSSPAGAVFRVGTAPPEGYVRWLLPDDPHLLGYIVGGRVLVLVNAGATPATFREVEVPPGRWRLVADGERVDPVRGVSGPDARLRDGRSYEVSVPPQSLRIWVRQVGR